MAWWRRPVVGITVALAVTATGCERKPAEPAAAPPVEFDPVRHRVPLDDDDPALGGEHPLVTIVVFTDYACARCASTWGVMERLVEDYGDDLRVVARPFTARGFARAERAIDAALAAAAQGKFWEMHARLVADPAHFGRPELRAHAEALGLDVERFLDDLDREAHAGVRTRNRRQAEALGVPELPAAFVNGRLVAGEHESPAWHGIVDAELRAARQVLASGVPRAKLYATLMKDATAEGAAGSAEPAPPREQPTATPGAEPEATPGAEPTARRGPDPKLRYEIPTDDAPTIGPDDALVEVVEFVDVRCPYCRRAWAEVLEPLLEQHPADVRLVVHQIPLAARPDAHRAAVAALAAQAQGEFTAFHRALLAHEGTLDRQDLGTYARELGLDRDRLLADLDDPALARRVAADLELAVALGVTTTPGFFVNGRSLSGFDPGALRRMVDEELQAARAALKAGTPRAEVVRARLGESPVGPPDYPNR